MKFKMKAIVSFAMAVSMLVTAPLSSEKSRDNEYNTNSITALAAEAVNYPNLNIQRKPLPDNAAIEFVEDMELGWNLGNTMDAIDDTGWVPTKMDIETCWNGGPKTNQGMIDTVKAAGFNTVRVPVSWHNHVDGQYNIDKEWMDRVQEIIDYAYNQDMYVIINVHHDNDKKFMYPDTAHYEQSKKYMTAIWKQVAERFKDYDERLIMETMNEPRLVGDVNEWWIDLNRAECVDSIKTINKLNQDCVDVIRASGGNNSSRYIAVPGYDCSIDGVTNQYFELPKDSAKDKMIVAVHAYTPYHFALEEEGSPTSVSTFEIGTKDSAELDTIFDSAYNKFISKGIPVYIGEFACPKKPNNLQDRVDFSTYYIAAARARGITCCWWDAPGGMQLLDRGAKAWKEPEIITALNKYADASGKSDNIEVPGVPEKPPVPDVPEYNGKYESAVPDKDGNVSFTRAIGEAVDVEIELKNGATFVNGCIGFVVKVDGNDYWVAYPWDTKKSATITLNMNAPEQVSKLLGDESETITDENEIAAVAAEIKKQTSAMAQVWWASDSSGAEIAPATDAADIVAVKIRLEGNSEEQPATTTTTTTSTTTTATTSTTATTTTAPATTTEPVGNVLYGDANCDGKVTVADAASILQYLANSDKYTLTEQGARNSDCSNSGNGITVDDAIAIQKLDAKIINALPVTE